jgi:hypothetical protein
MIPYSMTSYLQQHLIHGKFETEVKKREVAKPLPRIASQPSFPVNPKCGGHIIYINMLSSYSG